VTYALRDVGTNPSGGPSPGCGDNGSSVIQNVESVRTTEAALAVARDRSTVRIIHSPLSGSINASRRLGVEVESNVDDSWPTWRKYAKLSSDGGRQGEKT
jgi:nitrogenase subunit NifH